MCYALLGCAPFIARAQEEQAAAVPVDDHYQGNVELGYVNTGGNSQTQTVNAKTKIEAFYSQWRQTLRLEALSSSDGDVTTAERYLAFLKTDYDFSEKDYTFFLLNYENDRFSGYDYHMSAVLGYGRRAVERESLRLDLEGGPGFRRSRLGDGSIQENAVLRLAGTLEWQLSESALFEEEISTEMGEEATISRSQSTLTVQIVGSLATKLAYTWRYTSEVPAGVLNQDTAASVTLVYKF